MQLCILIDLKTGDVFRSVVKSNEALDIEIGTKCIELEQRDAIPEYVVNLPQSGRLRRNRQMGLQQSLIKAIAWTKKQPMFAQTHRSLVSIPGQMPNDEHRHVPPGTAHKSGDYPADSLSLISVHP
jgi:hypothetical protein